MENKISHSNKNSIFSDEKTYALDDDVLTWSSDTVNGTVPYGSIRKLQLMEYPSQIGTAWQCKLWTSGGEKLIIRSEHFAGFADPEDRFSTFAPFVAGLTQAIKRANPEAKLVFGSNIYWIFWIICFVAFVLLTILCAMALLGGADWSLGMFAIATGMFAKFVWSLVKKGGAKPLDPANPFSV